MARATEDFRVTRSSVVSPLECEEDIKIMTNFGSYRRRRIVSFGKLPRLHHLSCQRFHLYIVILVLSYDVLFLRRFIPTTFYSTVTVLSTCVATPSQDILQYCQMRTQSVTYVAKTFPARACATPTLGNRSSVPSWSVHNSLGRITRGMRI
jgi:hypothetical protein